MRGPAQACHSSKQTPPPELEDTTEADADEDEVGETDPEAEDGVCVSSSSVSITFRSIKPPIKERETEIKIRALL